MDLVGAASNHSFTSAGYNLIGSGAAQADFNQPGDRTNQLALLAPLAFNGGPTLTHALLPGSPVLDAGTINTIAVVTNHQRGPGYPRLAGSRVDIGAYESRDVDFYRQAVMGQPALVGFYPVDGDALPKLTDRKLPAQDDIMTNSALIVAGAGTVGTHSLHGGVARLGTVPECRFSSGAGTVEALALPDRHRRQQPVLFACRSAAQTRYSLHSNAGGTNTFYVWNGTSVVVYRPPLNLLNRLVHVGFVCSNQTVTTYFNGASLGTSGG